jgi:mono/diheme cytochrome c family protein
MSTPMMRPFDARLVVALALGAALSTTLGCERDASGLTEWTPADHDHQSEPKQRHNLQTQTQKNNPHAAPSNKDQVIDVTWQKQCATCHGRRGKGDGPSSTMVKARDLTNADFQATLTDEQIAKVIREGKDKMPAFNLPDSIIQGLVQHVRGMAKKKRTSHDDDEGVDPGADDDTREPAAGSAPAASAPAANAPAPNAAPANAPASTGSAPVPPSAAPKPGAADKAPQLPTQAPTTQPPGAATPPSAPAPSAPHP